jgi:hypothetical protein
MPAPGHCPNCNALTASDQRYCLNCGQRLAEPRVEFRHALGLAPVPATGSGTPSRWDQRTPVVTVSAIAAVLLALGVGIVIGRGNGPTSSPRAQVVTVNSGGGSAAAASTTPSGSAQPVASISDDWSAGKSAYTVEIGALDKSGALAAAVAKAKSDATAKGATAVGALDGDAHSGTPTGKYVIYSGQYASKKQAEAALAKLKKNFPGALVLHVTPQGSGSSGGSNSGSNSGGSAATNAGASQAANLRNLSGQAYVKASAKLPSQVGTGGAPPPKDNKKAGGGTSATCIGC